jgi:hypothetical protein
LDSSDSIDGLFAVCAACSAAIQFDLATLGEQLIAQCSIWHPQTGRDEAEAEGHVTEAYQRWEKRSGRVWTTNLTRLRDYGIEP